MRGPGKEIEDTGPGQGERGDPIIRINRVTKSFGAFQALRSVSADVSLGERVVVCGPSGSGKSTLVRCVGGLERHESGTIVVDGITLDHRRESIPSIRSASEWCSSSSISFRTSRCSGT